MLRHTQLKRVLSIAIPVSCKLFLDMGMTLVDLYMVSPMGTKALAAVGMGSLLISASTGVLEHLLTTSTGILIARLKGAKQLEDTRQVLFNLLLLVIPLSILTLVIASYAEPIYLLLNSTPAVASIGCRYWGTILYGSPLLYLDALFFTYFVAMGDSQYPMKIKIISIVFNIAFNSLFINGQLGLPALGVQGAALGTVLAMALNVCLYLRKILREQQYGFICRISTKWLNKILHLGIPSILENLTFQISWLFIIALINHYSTNASAGFQVGFRVESIAFLPGLGAATAATTLVSQYIGARNPTQANHAVTITALVTLMFMGSIGILMTILPRQFAMIFTTDPHVIHHAATYIQLIGATQIPLGLQFVYRAALQGMGKVKSTAFLKVSLLWICILIPSLFVVKLGADVKWIDGIISAANIIDATVFILYFNMIKTVKPSQI